MNSQEVKPLVLLNDGNCTLYYRLVLEQQEPKGLKSDPCGTVLRSALGLGPGRGVRMCLYVCVCVLKIDGPYMQWVRQDS